MVQWDHREILRLENLTRQFSRHGTPAVDRVHLTLQSGELLGLLGPSGCGKTTLLRLIAGFEKPQAGTIILAGRRVCGQGAWVPPERRDIGLVFQDYALFPHLTVIDNVAFGLKPLARQGKLPAARVQDQAQSAIALVGLTGLEKRYPHELSGGQQQRVALARALAPRPSLILLDEPFSNLDVQVRLYLRQEVRNILKGINASGIFVTHDQEEALSIADRLAVLRQGHVEQMGTPEDVYRQPLSRFVAGFVTQANFLPARRAGDRWETLLGSFPVTPAVGSVLRGELMVRQEDLRLQPAERGELAVRDRQFLGREYRYTVMTPTGQTLYARTSTETRLEPGTPVHGIVTVAQPQVFPVATDSDLAAPAPLSSPTL